MARLLLSEADDWQLSFPDEHDVRGFRVLDAHRAETGQTVTDLVVDTNAERVSHLVLSDGTEYPADDVSIGDGVVFATTEGVSDARRTADVSDYGRVSRRSDAAAYNDPLAPDSLAAGTPSPTGTDAALASGTAATAGPVVSGSDAFSDPTDNLYRTHYASQYAGTGRDYDAYRPAYDYGREQQARYGDRSFDEVEPQLRGDYAQRHGDGSVWDDVKDAVRHAYDRARDAVREAAGPPDSGRTQQL